MTRRYTHTHTHMRARTHTHTHTHPFNGPFSGITQVSRYQKGKTNLDFTEARDSKWQWHQLEHMQVFTSLLTDNHANTSPLSFLQAGCPSCHPTNSVKALKALLEDIQTQIITDHEDVAVKSVINCYYLYVYSYLYYIAIIITLHALVMSPCYGAKNCRFIVIVVIIIII